VAFDATLLGKVTVPLKAMQAFSVARGVTATAAFNSLSVLLQFSFTVLSQP
jgi:hypothetical protein